jgi:basic membrane protein A
MRKLLSVLLAFVLAVTILTGCGTPGPEADAIRIGLVTDLGGRGDQSFNDSALRGLEIWAAGKAYVQGGGYADLSDADYQKSLAKNASDLTGNTIKRLGNIAPIMLESKEQTDYMPNLTNLTEDEKCRLVIAVGYMLADATYQVAKDHPDTRFMLIDAVPTDPQTFQPLPQLPNLVCYVFREEQCGFLAGAIAGLATRNNRIGFIGGMPVSPVQRYEAGFFAGIKTTNPIAYGTDGKNVPSVYAGSFGDQPKGKQIAQTMLAQRCDILFHAAGAQGNGMFAALKEAGGPSNGLWGIGVGVDMGKNPNLYPAGTLTSAMKHVDYATYKAVRSVIDNTFTGTTITMSLKDGGVAYAPDHVAEVLSADQAAQIEHLRTMIIDGTLVPPTDPKAVPAWTAPTSF